MTATRDKALDALRFALARACCVTQSRPYLAGASTLPQCAQRCVLDCLANDSMRAPRACDRLRHAPRPPLDGIDRAESSAADGPVSAALDIDHFRDRLLEERKRAQDALEYLQKDDQGLLDDEHEEIQSDNHIADDATSTYDRELDATLEDNEERMLDAIDAALKRIEDGTYGICANCGEPIGQERLEALPWTTQCIDCKRKEERS